MKIFLEKFRSKGLKKIVWKSNNYLDKVEIFWDQFFAVVHDEDTSNIQFDVVLLFLVLKQIEGSSFGNKQECTEFQLTFNAEMFDGQMFFPVIGQGFVKFTIFLLTNIVRVASPDGFGLVQLLVFNIFFLEKLFG